MRGSGRVSVWAGCIGLLAGGTGFSETGPVERRATLERVDGMIGRLDAEMEAIRKAVGDPGSDNAMRLAAALALLRQTASGISLDRKLGEARGLLDAGAEGSARERVREIIGDIDAILEALSPKQDEPSPEDRERVRKELGDLLDRQQEVRARTERAAVPAGKAGLAGEQNDLRLEADRIADLLDRMSEQSGSAGSPSDATRATRGASSSMDKASRQLGGADGREGARSTGSAMDHQRDAERKIRDAIDAIEEGDRELQAEDRVRKLLEIEAALRQIKDREEIIRTATVALDNRKGEMASRIRAEARSISALQKEAVEAARFVVETLDEGNVPTYAGCLTDAVGIMEQVARRLDEAKTGRETQGREEEILQILDHLINALKEDRKPGGDSPPPPAPPGGEPPLSPPSGDQKQPLVPDAAQLRMLKLMELRVQSSVLGIENMRAGGTDDESLAEDRSTAAGRQRRVVDLTLEMAKSLEAGAGGAR